MKHSFLQRVLWLLIPLLTLFTNQLWATDVYYTVASKTSVSQTGTKPTGSSATFSQSGNNDAGQMTANGTTTLTLSGFDGKKITGISLYIRKTSGTKTATVTAKTGSTTFCNVTIASNNLPTSLGTRTVTLSSQPIIATGATIEIKIKASANSVYINKYTITWEDATSYNVDFETGTGNPIVARRTGATITLPSTTDLTPACSDDGWTLYGWATASYSENTVAPSATLAGLAGASYSPSDHVTLYAVYRKVEGSGPDPGTVLWGENFAHFSTNTPSTAGTGTGTTKYDNATINYTQSTNDIKAYGDTYAGGEKPELLLYKNNAYWTVSGIKTGNLTDGYATDMTFSFKSNYPDRLSLSSPTSNISCTVDANDNTIWHITNTNNTSFTLVLTNTNSSNMRIDDISLVTDGAATYNSNPTCCDPLGSINGSSIWS